jgi:hypothetical protein
MKRHLPLAAVLLMAFASLCLAQEPQPSPSPKPKAPRVTKEMLLKELSDMETALWNAFKDKDAKPFEEHLTDDSVMVGERGVEMKTDVVKMMPQTPCDVKSFTLSDWKMTKFSATNVLLTYKSVTQGTCGGAPIPSTWVSTLWVKRKNVWQAAFHQESPVK